jgi:hypothetical protein
MKTKYAFTLKDINTEKVDQRFGITIIPCINTSKTPYNTTKISDLSVNKNIPEIISFLDEAKKSHKCVVSMIDFSNKTEINELCVKYNCFWCRNKIPDNVLPIGCPIKYVPSQAIKTYFSEISKDTYTIKEQVTNLKIKEIEKGLDERLKTISKNYYVTDGIFCSFNCCMSYITNNKYNSMYGLSEMLLLKMYNDIYPSVVPCIEEAPNWRKLVQYGGDLTIDQFRTSFNKIEYKKHGYINDVLSFKSMGFLFEEKLKF